MQADSIVQQPENLQNLNRYTCVFNNMLSYTDPTGYCAASSFSTKQPGCDVQQQAEAAAVTNDKETKEVKENEGAATSESNDNGGWFSLVKTITLHPQYAGKQKQRAGK